MAVEVALGAMNGELCRDGKWVNSKSSSKSNGKSNSNISKILAAEVGEMCRAAGQWACIVIIIGIGIVIAIETAIALARTQRGAGRKVFVKRSTCSGVLNLR